MSALAAYEAALLSGSGIVARTRHGLEVQLPVDRWLDDASPCDMLIADMCKGRTIEVGCGPGRLTYALTRAGRHAVGIDVSMQAVRIARSRGVTVFKRDVFGPVPDSGGWDHVLLADGNIGIGGDPVRLLQRCLALLRPAGSIVVEVEPPGGRDGKTHVRVSSHGHGGWLPWAWVSIDSVGAWAQLVGLEVKQMVATGCGRHAVELSRPAPARTPKAVPCA